jgi:RHS repeat-associated protein
MPNGSGYSYDAENHLLSTAGVTYTYDGDGTRVEKSSGTIYWHGAGGDALDESNLSGSLTNEYIFFGGQRIARRDPSSNVFYYFSDHLGTARSIAEVPSGQTTATKCYDADLYPYGGERWYTDSCDSHFKFTGKERDTESGLDNFGARYNSSSLGRFMTPDWSAEVEPVPYAKLGNPQSLNLYSYVLNNPMTLFDTNGHDGSCGGAAHDGSACTITLTEITQRVTFYDQSGNVVSTVSVTTSLTTVSNSITGAVVSASASATATNVSGLQFSSSQLATIGSTVGAVQQAGASMALGTNPSQLITAITAKESTLGVTAPTNPLQLACSSGSCANGDRRHNIKGALDVLQTVGRNSNYDPASTYSRYNGVPDPIQRATNVQNFMNIYNGMTQSFWSFSPSPPPAPIPPGLQ